MPRNTTTRKTNKTTKTNKTAGDLKTLPMDVMIETLSFLKHEPAVLASKVVRTAYDTEKTKGVLQNAFKSSRIPHNKCLEAIYAKYPFLPRQDGYIHIYPTLFDNFSTECKPNNFYNQIEQCCFRIDYHQPEILEYILDPSRVSFTNKAALLKVLEGIAETFHTRNEDAVIDFRDAQTDLRRMYQLLTQLVMEHESSLSAADLHAMINVLSSKRFMEWSYGYMAHIDAKVKLIAKLITKIPTLERRLEFITTDLDSKKWTKFLEYKYGYITLLMKLLRWTPPLSVPRKWNAMLIKLIIKPPMDKEYVRMLYRSFFNALRLISENNQWEQHADYYLNYFVSNVLPAPPAAVRHDHVFNVLNAITPTTNQGIHQWFRLFAAIHGRLSDKMKRIAIMQLMDRIASNDPQSLPRLVEIYDIAKSIDFVFDHPKIRVLEYLEKEMNKMVLHHNLIPGATKKQVKEAVADAISAI